VDHAILAIGKYHDFGTTELLRSPLAVVAFLVGRLGRYQPAARIAGFALSPVAIFNFPGLLPAIARLREALGDEAYESLAREGQLMPTAAMVTYAYDQIDQARAELNAVS